jgi:hypothetical protein
MGQGNCLLTGLREFGQSLEPCTDKGRVLRCHAARRITGNLRLKKPVSFAGLTQQKVKQTYVTAPDRLAVARVSEGSLTRIIKIVLRSQGILDQSQLEEF